MATSKLKVGDTVRLDKLVDRYERLSDKQRYIGKTGIIVSVSKFFNVDYADLIDVKFSDNRHLCLEPSQVTLFPELRKKHCRKEKKPKNNNWPKKVLCVETKVIYENVTKASEFAGVHPSTIRQACRGVSMTAGRYHWKYL